MTIVYAIAVLGVLAIVFGLILVVTREGDILENKIVYTVLGKIIDLFRAIPFIILVMILSDVTKFVSGTSIGLRGSFFPLIVGTIPFFARQIEQAIAEVDRGLIEASEAMGLTPLQIMFRVYLRESVPSIIRATTITLISLIGLTAIVGAIGGGGVVLGSKVCGRFSCFNSSIDNLRSDSELTFHDLLHVLRFVEPVIPAPHALGCGVGDVLPAVCPPHLIALALHQRDKLAFGGSVPHALVDGVHQPELPALALGGGAILAGAHALGLFFLLLW